MTKGGKKTGIILVVVVVLCVASFFVGTQIVLPKMNYNNAVKAMQAGQYDAAITAFTELGDYKDSKTLINQMDADQLYENGKYADAWTVYAALPEAYQTHNAEYAEMYAAADKLLTDGRYDDAAAAFAVLGDYRDVKARTSQCSIDKANALYAAGKFIEAAEAYAFINDAEKVNESIYMHAGQLADQHEELRAADVYWSIREYRDSEEQHYQMGLKARANGKLTDACAILSTNLDYSNARETIYRIGIDASAEKHYDVSIPAFTQVGAYKDAAMKLTMDTYSWGGQLYDNAEYDLSAEVFDSLGDFSSAPLRANEARYAAAGAAMDAGNYDDAVARYTALGEYSNSKEKAKECDYLLAKALYDDKQYSDALNAFENNHLAGYRDADILMSDCRYNLGKSAMAAGDFVTARDWFDAVGDYSDAKAQANECRHEIAMETAKNLEVAGDYESAYAQYELAGITDKMLEMAYLTALVKLSESDYEGAISWYEKAGTYSDAKEQILSIAEYYYATQQYDAAEVVYVKVLGTGNAAQRLYELGQYYELVGNNEHAAKCYREAGEYEDAPEKAVALQNEDTYQAAESLFQAKDWEGARTEYLKIAGYKDVDSKVATCDNEIAAAAAARRAEFTTVSKTFTFGHYEQDNNTGNGKEAIEWQVLDVKGDKVLIISKNTLDVKAYNSSWTSITWEKCTLRTWLNKDFLNAAFSAAEQAGIETTTVDNSKAQGYSGYSANGGNNTQDKVFLLSYAETWKYFGSNSARVSTPTKYAKANEGSGLSNWWWLRSPGDTQLGAAFVYSDGSLLGCYVSGTLGVRPALWVNLESGIFKSYISTGSWE